MGLRSEIAQHGNERTVRVFVGNEGAGHQHCTALNRREHDPEIAELGDALATRIVGEKSAYHRVANAANQFVDAGDRGNCRHRHG